MQSIRTWWVLMLGLAAIILVLSVGSLSAEHINEGEPPLPPPPTNLEYSLTPQGVLLEWTEADPEVIPSGMTLYQVLVMVSTSEGRNGGWVLGYVDAGETSFLDDDSSRYYKPEILVAEAPRWYSVRAEYQDDSGAMFVSDRAWVEADLSFGSIASVTLTETAEGVTVTWTAPPLSWLSDAVPVSAYRVYRITMAEGEGEPDRYPGYHHLGYSYGRLITSVDTPALSILDTDATAGAIYSYSVRPIFGVFIGDVTYSDDVIVVSQPEETSETSEE